MGLLRELIAAEAEEGDNLAAERLGGLETLSEEHNLRDVLAVGGGHGDGAEELLEVVGEVGTARVAGVHGDEHAHIVVDSDAAVGEDNLVGAALEALLNRLNLLRDGGQDALLETVELIEATPCADLAEANENAAHGLEIEGLIAAEDKNEATQGVTEGLNGLRLTSTGRSSRAAAEAGVERLRERQETLVCEGGLDEALGEAEVLKAVLEGRVGHAAHEGRLGVVASIVIGAHRAEPVEVLGVLDAPSGELTGRVTLIDCDGDDLLRLVAGDGVEVRGEDVGGELVKHVRHVLLDGACVVAGGQLGLHQAHPLHLNGKSDDLCRGLLDPLAKARAGLGDALNTRADAGAQRGDHGVLELREPLVDREAVGVEGLVELYSLRLGADHRLEQAGLLLGGLDGERRETAEHLLEVLGDEEGVLAVTDNLEQVFVSDEVETREAAALGLEVLAERLLDHVELAANLLERLQNLINGDEAEDGDALSLGLGHERNELFARAVELRGLGGQLVADLNAAAEDTVKVDPLALHINEHLEDLAGTVKLIVPVVGRRGDGVAIVRAELHRRQRVEVLAELLEENVPALDERHAVLEEGHLEGVVVPELRHVVDLHLQAVLALRVLNDGKVHLAVDDGLRLPNVAEGELGDDPLRLLQLRLEGDPVTVEDSVAAEVRNEAIVRDELLEVGIEDAIGRKVADGGVEIEHLLLQAREGLL